VHTVGTLVPYVQPLVDKFTLLVTGWKNRGLSGQEKRLFHLRIFSSPGRKRA